MWIQNLSATGIAFKFGAYKAEGCRVCVLNTDVNLQILASVFLFSFIELFQTLIVDDTTKHHTVMSKLFQELKKKYPVSDHT